MDLGILYFVALITIILVNIFIKNKQKKKEITLMNSQRRGSRRLSRLSGEEEESSLPSSSASSSFRTLHPLINELKGLSIDDLERRDILHGRHTDRYWREIFRRHNEEHPPDRVSLHKLSIQSVITVIEECIPQGTNHFTVTGISQKYNPQTHSTTLKHLRKRYPPNTHEITIEGDIIEVRAISSRRSPTSSFDYSRSE